MNPKAFSEEDEKKYVEALNWIAKEARFNEGPSTIGYMIQARNHFAFLQSIATKINSNILEVKAVHIPEKEKAKPKKKGTK